jgi:DhnA family fructose-bisphosphate aldolase class Ia
MTGKRVRLARLFRDDGRSVVVALDHGQFKGTMRGIENLSSTLQRVVDGGADAIILNPGALERATAACVGRCAIILRVTGASTDANPSFDYHRQILSVERAVGLGADAVIAMGFVGGAGEGPSLALLAEIAEACGRWGMPLIAEMLIADPKKFHDVPSIALGARVAYELGADVVKAYGGGESTFADIPRSCPVPVLVAGGAKSEDPVEMARQAVKRGAAGIAFGRTVFGAENPTQTVRALVEVVHKKGG